MVRARFFVGIDLGTTHTVVASARCEGSAETEVFAIAQLVAATEVASRPLLPSGLYAALPSESASDPWGDAPWILGEYARRRSSDVPGRAVASHKSWLSHARVDRTAAILPWGSAGDGDDATLRLISPVDAAARVLAHVRRAWNDAHPSDPLEAQQVVLTIPASFDEVARELTLEAARRAELTVTLLEEPQAAFYDLAGHMGQPALAELANRAGGEATVLVCDVGGGTTNLSLLRVRSVRVDVAAVERVAVGRHLLLGGDNMDLALAHLVEPRLVEPPKRLEATRFAQLALACRDAKERLLGSDPPSDVAVTLLGSGAKLLGASLTARLSRDDAEKAVVDAFFPRVERSAAPERKGGGLVALGLPYERDVAITRHIANFIARHGATPGPHAVLFNGGVFRAPRIVERTVATIEGWGGPKLEVLPAFDPDLAVARGAVAFGKALAGRGIRIDGGAARGFYLGLPPERGASRSLVCVLPRGAREATPHVASGRTFALTVGRPVRFNLFASDEATDHAGAVVAYDDERFEPLPPAFAAFDAAGGAPPEIRVVVEGELSPVGTLDLSCVEATPADPAAPRRFRLTFDLHGDRAPDSVARVQSLRGVSLPAPPSIDEAPKRKAAREAVERVFGKGRADVSGREAKDLLRELERVLGERSTWTTGDARALFDAVFADPRARKRSADHERVFWMLAGYCIRPGFGDAHDGARLPPLWRLFAEKLAFPDEARGAQQFWIAWRRAAGGLDEAAQTAIRDVVDPWLAPSELRLKKPKGWKAGPDADIVDLAAALERVAPARRSALSSWLLERTWTTRDERIWAAIGRIGARVPAYASAHHVIAPNAAERLIDHLSREKWDRPVLAQAAVMLARVTGDRARDVSEHVRREVERKLVAAGASERSILPVRELVAIDDADQRAQFGESLPVGIRLVE